MNQNLNTISNPNINLNPNTSLNQINYPKKEINILDDIEYTHCQRCKVKSSVFSCLICESFKFLCTKCDNYVHSLPSKQSHQRIAITEKKIPKEKSTINLEEEKEQDRKENENILNSNNIQMQNLNLNHNQNNHLSPNDENGYNFAYKTTNDLNYKFNLSPINKEYNNNRTNQQNFRRYLNNNINPYSKEENYLNNNINIPNNNNDNGYNIENTNASISINRIENNNLINDVNNENSNAFSKKSNINSNVSNNQINTNAYPNNIVDSNINSNSNQNVNKSLYMNNSIHNSSIDSSSSFRIPNAQNFSREYVYEIKTIFEKEKSELLYKINSLNMTIERLKINFTDQINYLSNQLEDVNKKSNWTIRQNQENFEKKVKQNQEDKELLYDDFKTKLTNLEIVNKELTEKLEESLKNMLDLKTSSSNKISNLENLIKIKDEELAKEKLNNENKLNDLRKYMEDDKIKLMESYDKNINLLIQEFDVTKEKLNNLLKDREEDLRNLMEKHKLEIDRLQNINKEILNEIECHKSNIYNIRIRSEEDKDELEVLKDDNDSMKRELRFQISELKMLDGHNKSLLKENEDLKIQISKLDKLVYGKIRMPQNIK